MNVHTRSQMLAQAAYLQIARHDKLAKEYVSFAKKFPALVHTCGLAQAIAFAQAKGAQKDPKKPTKAELLYLEDLTKVLAQSGYANITTPANLDTTIRTEPVSGYLRLSRDAINAASWLKRYVEAAAPDETEGE